MFYIIFSGISSVKEHSPGIIIPTISSGRDRKDGKEMKHHSFTMYIHVHVYNYISEFLIRFEAWAKLTS